LQAAAQTQCPTNIKKGQFLAPEDMQHAVGKFRQAGGKHVAVTERGTTFGYHNLVVDMRGLPLMQASCQAPVIFDATHSVQRPSANNGVSGGDRHMAPVLARAAAAAGIDGLFCEVHPDPDNALSDGPNSLSFDLLESTLDAVVAIRAALAPKPV
jgi:2-dehydro-3-deoxyphosphooctonate aldolase (KDO 8-P synthase)